MLRHFLRAGPPFIKLDGPAGPLFFFQHLYSCAINHAMSSFSTFLKTLVKVERAKKKVVIRISFRFYLYHKIKI